MYNRYLSHDEGSYQHIPFEAPSNPSSGCEKPSQNEERGVRGFLQKLMEKLKLSRFDKGDLLLLLILLLLYSEEEDEELLFALVLLFLL